MVSWEDYGVRFFHVGRFDHSRVVTMFRVPILSLLYFHFEGPYATETRLVQYEYPLVLEQRG